MWILSDIFFKEIIFLFLGGVVCVVLCIIFFFRKKRINFTEGDVLSQVYSHSSLWYYIHISTMVLVTFCIFLYLSHPYGQQKIETIKKDGIDIEIVMDLSYSMIADDITPTRLEVAKSMFIEFIDEITSDRVGLILFSGKPFQSVPLSYDYEFLQDFVSDIEIDIIEQTNPLLQGTAIGDALILASDTLLSDAYSDEQREKIIILLTDGEANRWAEPLIALSLLKEQNIKVYTIGVGKNESTIIRVEVAPGLYQNVEIGWVDEEILQKIAAETGGEYYRADSASTLRDIGERIAALETSEIEYEIQSIENSYRFLITLILFFLSGVIVFTTCVKHIRHV